MQLVPHSCFFALQLVVLTLRTLAKIEVDLQRLAERDQQAELALSA